MLMHKIVEFLCQDVDMANGKLNDDTVAWRHQLAKNLVKYGEEYHYGCASYGMCFLDEKLTKLSRDLDQSGMLELPGIITCFTGSWQNYGHPGARMDFALTVYDMDRSQEVESKLFDDFASKAIGKEKHVRLMFLPVWRIYDPEFHGGVTTEWDEPGFMMMRLAGGESNLFYTAHTQPDKNLVKEHIYDGPTEMGRSIGLDVVQAAMNMATYLITDYGAVTAHPEPRKLNINRKKKGQVPLKKHYTVITKTRYERRENGGTHASPIAHMRRRHPRFYRDENGVIKKMKIIEKQLIGKGPVQEGPRAHRVYMDNRSDK